jgi:hypothetical protein
VPDLLQPLVTKHREQPTIELLEQSEEKNMKINNSKSLLGKRNRDFESPDLDFSSFLDQNNSMSFLNLPTKRTTIAASKIPKWDFNFKPTLAQNHSSPHASKSYLQENSLEGTCFQIRSLKLQQKGLLKSNNLLQTKSNNLKTKTENLALSPTLSPSSSVNQDLEIAKLKAGQLAQRYNGECLSLTTHISIVKGE